MRKGRLEKTHNLRKNSSEWERNSRNWKKNNNHISVRAYLNAHDMKTYVGLVELNTYTTRIRFGFATIEDAFNWAEGMVDYKNETLKDYDK